MKDAPATKGKGSSGEVSHQAERVRRYMGPVDYDRAFAEVKKALGAAFWGPPAKGVYSPSVQYTLFQMAKLALERFALLLESLLCLPSLAVVLDGAARCAALCFVNARNAQQVSSSIL